MDFLTRMGLTLAQRRRMRRTTGRKPGRERTLLDELVHLARLGDEDACKAFESGTAILEPELRAEAYHSRWAEQNREDLARRRRAAEERAELQRQIDAMNKARLRL